MQTNLEKKGITARNDSSVKNTYDKEGQYSLEHENALSNGKVKGKGTGRGGHTHSVPDASKPSTVDYSNFSPNDGGGLYDINGHNGIGGREFLKTISLYGPENEYGAHLIDTSANLVDGQIMIM